MGAIIKAAGITKGKILTILFLTLVLVSSSNACTFAWDAVTTYTDGSPATEINYRLYVTPRGSTIPQVIADTPQTTATVLCPAGTYVVVAYNATAAESEDSNSVVLKHTGRP